MKALARCMGGGFCHHGPGECTADPTYQAEIAAQRRGSYPTIRPDEVHPTHDVRDEGLYITDPICRHCHLGAVESGEDLKQPCRLAGAPKEP